MNETMRKFDYPGSLIREFDHWCVLLRPEQATLGALVLACKEPVQAFGLVSPEGFTELQLVTRQLEQALAHAFEYQKINYLMLMMVDPDVHFHVLPRYASASSFKGVSFADEGWPGPPNLGASTSIDGAVRNALLTTIQASWPS